MTKFGFLQNLRVATDEADRLLVASSLVMQTALTVSGAAASAGDNILITGVADKQIVLTSIIMQNESTTPTTMILYDGPSTDALPLARCLGQNQGDGLAWSLAADERKKLRAGTGLVLHLSGANSCGYTIGYYLE